MRHISPRREAMSWVAGTPICSVLIPLQRMQHLLSAALEICNKVSPSILLSFGPAAQATLIRPSASVPILIISESPAPLCMCLHICACLRLQVFLEVVQGGAEGPQLPPGSSGHPGGLRAFGLCFQVALLAATRTSALSASLRSLQCRGQGSGPSQATGVSEAGPGS